MEDRWMVIRVAATTAALVALVAVGFASPAEARWTSDVCPLAGFDRFNAPDLGPNEERFCNPQFQVDPTPDPGLEWVNDPYWEHAFSLTGPEPPWDPASGCGLGWSIKGSDSDDEDATIPPSADWDYWVGSVLSGISFLPPWGGTATWAARGTNDTQKGLLGAFAIYPEYVNWAPWGSSVQTLATCVPATARAALPSGAGNGRLRAPQAAGSVGTPGDDRIATGDDRDRIEGGAGDDRIATRDERDFIHGGTGNDRINAGGGHDDAYGGDSEDILRGGAGNDTLAPGPHDDVATAGTGQDRLFDNHGDDELRGGAHTDFLSARDGDRDIVDCGPGKDVAVGDDEDVYRDCERVYDDPDDDPSRPPRLG
jgi:hypothetical protein